MGVFGLSEKCWYYFHNSKQVGPVLKSQLVKKIHAGGLKSSSLIFKTGWDEWKKLSNVQSEIISSDKPSPPPPPPQSSSTEEVLTFSSSSDKEKSNVELVHQARSDRKGVQGQVIVHNNDNLIFAQSVNISAEGIFIKTEKPIFYIGEILKLTCRILEVGAPFNAQAQVVRRSSSVHEPSGYGLYFTLIKPEIVEKIRQITMSSKAS